MDKVDIKEILLLYGHWMALGLAGVLVVGTLFLGGDSENAETLESIEKWITRKVIQPGTSQIAKVATTPSYYENLKANWEQMEEFRVLTDISTQAQILSEWEKKQFSDPRDITVLNWVLNAEAELRIQGKKNEPAEILAKMTEEGYIISKQEIKRILDKAKEISKKTRGIEKVSKALNEWERGEAELQKRAELNPKIIRWILDAEKELRKEKKRGVADVLAWLNKKGYIVTGKDIQRIAKKAVEIRRDRMIDALVAWEKLQVNLCKDGQPDKKALNKGDISLILSVSESMAEEDPKKSIGAADVLSAMMLPDEEGNTPDISASAEDVKRILERAGKLKKKLKKWQTDVFAQKGPGQHFIYAEATLNWEKLPAPERQWMSTIEGIELEVNEGDMEVSLSWDKPSRYSLDNHKKPTTIEGYILFKDWEDRGKEFKKYIDIRGGNNTNYEDKDVETKITYRYSVCAYTENYEAKGGEKFDIPLIAPYLKLSQETKDKIGKNELGKEEWLEKLIRSNIAECEDTAYIPSPYRIAFKGIIGSKVLIRIYRKMRDGEEKMAECQAAKGQAIETTKTEKNPDTGEVEVLEFKPHYKLLDIMKRYKSTTQVTKEKRLAVLTKELFILKAKYEPRLDKGDVTKKLRKDFYAALGIKIKKKEARIEPTEKSAFWGTVEASGNRCLVPDKRSFIKLRGKAWLLNYKNGKKLYLIEKHNNGLRVYDARKGNWQRNKTTKEWIEESVVFWSVVSCNAIKYLDEKGEIQIVLQDSSRAK